MNISLIEKFKAWRKRRRKQKNLDRLAKSGFGLWLEGDDDFDPKREGGQELDAVNNGVVEVLPTYYEYDEDGNPTGNVNGDSGGVAISD